MWSEHPRRAAPRELAPAHEAAAVPGLAGLLGLEMLKGNTFRDLGRVSPHVWFALLQVVL